MGTPSNNHRASSRRSKALGVMLAGGILFAIGIGGPGALWGAFTTVTSDVVQSQG